MNSNTRGRIPAGTVIHMGRTQGENLINPDNIFYEVKKIKAVNEEKYLPYGYKTKKPKKDPIKIRTML